MFALRTSKVHTSNQAPVTLIHYGIALLSSTYSSTNCVLMNEFASSDPHFIYIAKNHVSQFFLKGLNHLHSIYYVDRQGRVCT